MATFNENINIAILGPVSVGKSTFINSIFCDTMSEMKRKRTTMLPQIYQVTQNSKNINSTNTIIEKNTKSNDLIYEKRQNNTFNVKTDFSEIVHFVKSMDDFITLPNKNTTYSILDMPGLNDQFSDIYYDYIKQKSKQIDIYLVLFDITSSLNTTDEVKILQFVVDEIKKNKTGFLYVIINKCNDFEFNNIGFKIQDKELKELYDQAQNTVKQICKDINYEISPMCTNDLYVYRALAYNKTCNIPENDLDRIIKEEAGKGELKKMNTYEKKRKFIQGKINKDKNIYNNGITDSGYKLFKTKLQKIIDNNFEIFINNHMNLLIDDYIKSLNFEKYENTFVMNVSKFFIDIIERLNVVQNKNKLQLTVNPSSIINEYILKHINSYTEKLCDDTVEIIRYFNAVACKYCNTDILDLSIELLNNKKINVLKSQIRENYNIEKIKLLSKLGHLTCEDYKMSISKNFDWYREIAISVFNSCRFLQIMENTQEIMTDILLIDDNNMKFVETIILEMASVINDKFYCIVNTVNILFGERCRIFIDLMDTFSNNKNKKIKYLIYLLTNETKYINANKNDNFSGKKNIPINNLSYIEYEILYESVKSFVDFLDEKFNKTSKVTVPQIVNIKDTNNIIDDKNENECEYECDDDSDNNSCDSSNSCDESSDEKYLTDDDSDVIYMKAIKNANKTTKKNLSCVKND